MEIEETLGQRVRRLREERGLSQAKLAQAVGVHPSHVYLVESGRIKRLQPETLTLYARELQVSEDEFRTGSDHADELPEVEVYLRGKADLKMQEHRDYIAGMYRRLQRLEALEEGFDDAPGGGSSETPE